MTDPLPNPLRGVLMVLAAALCWGTTGTAQSFAPPTLSPSWVGALRLAVAALFFAVVIVALRAGPGLRRLPAGPVLLGGLAMAAYNLSFFAGVRAAGVAVGTAITIGSAPIWAGLLQAFAGQRPSGPWWLGTALAVAGGALLVGSGAGAAAGAAGVVLCLAAGLSYAVYALVNKRLVARAGATEATFAVFALAALIALPAAWAQAGPVTPTARDALIALWLGVVATGVAYLLFSHGLHHISGATGVTLALAEPVAAFVLALLVVGERPGWLAAAGALLVLGGLAVVVRVELRLHRRP